MGGIEEEGGVAKQSKPHPYNPDIVFDTGFMPDLKCVEQLTIL